MIGIRRIKGIELNFKLIYENIFPSCISYILVASQYSIN